VTTIARVTVLRRFHSVGDDYRNGSLSYDDSTSVGDDDSQGHCLTSDDVSQHSLDGSIDPLSHN